MIAEYLMAVCLSLICWWPLVIFMNVLWSQAPRLYLTPQAQSVSHYKYTDRTAFNINLLYHITIFTSYRSIIPRRCRRKAVFLTQSISLHLNWNHQYQLYLEGDCKTDQNKENNANVHLLRIYSILVLKKGWGYKKLQKMCVVKYHKKITLHFWSN